MGDNRILVAYASKHGATAEIAERIAGVLRQKGLQIDVATTEGQTDPGSYSAVVLGVSLYMGRWHKQAVRFLKQHESVLSGKPFWLFLSGPSGEGDPLELLEGRDVPPSLKPLIERINPRETRVFHGSLMPEKLGGFERWIIKKVKAPTGDFRDWTAIESWAASIAGGLVPQP